MTKDCSGIKPYFLDLEMLSINKQADRNNIIAIGMVDFGCTERFTLIQPTNSFKQSRYCEELTGITQGQFEGWLIGICIGFIVG